MRPINLLPPEALERAKARRRRWVWIAGGVAFLALLAAATVWFDGKVSERQDRLDDELAVVVQLEAEVAGLGDFANLKNEFENNKFILEAALDRDVVWGRLLNDFGRMLPDRVWLTSFTGQVNTDPLVPAIGEITVSGVGFDFPDISAWLRSLDSSTFPSVDQTWVSSISAGEIGEVPVVDFVSSTFLTAGSLSDRLALRIPETP
ncbi:MAG: PilN domain-containing protein [Acidimicrobiia bacterium]